MVKGQLYGMLFDGRLNGRLTDGKLNCKKRLDVRRPSARTFIFQRIASAKYQLSFSIVIHKSLSGHMTSNETFIRRYAKSRTSFYRLLNTQFRSPAHEVDKVMDDNYRPADNEQIKKIRKIPKTLTDPNFRFKLADSTVSLKIT